MEHTTFVGTYFVEEDDSLSGEGVFDFDFEEDGCLAGEGVFGFDFVFYTCMKSFASSCSVVCEVYHCSHEVLKFLF